MRADKTEPKFKNNPADHCLRQTKAVLDARSTPGNVSDFC